jgi:hypothetical protein
MSAPRIIMPAGAKYRIIKSVTEAMGPLPAGNDHIVFDEGRPGETSDGYHTFDELYEHRMALTLALMQSHLELSWKSKEHHPSNDKMFDGFFIVGIDTPAGVITYHYKLEHWDTFLGIRELPHSPAWDGHTPNDVAKRIRKWARQIKANRN